MALARDGEPRAERHRPHLAAPAGVGAWNFGRHTAVVLGPAEAAGLRADGRILHHQRADPPGPRPVGGRDAVRTAARGARRPAPHPRPGRDRSGVENAGRSRVEPSLRARGGRGSAWTGAGGRPDPVGHLRGVFDRAVGNAVADRTGRDGARPRPRPSRSAQATRRSTRSGAVGAMTETTMYDTSDTCSIGFGFDARSALREVRSRTARMDGTAYPPVRMPISPANRPGPRVAPSPQRPSAIASTASASPSRSAGTSPAERPTLGNVPPVACRPLARGHGCGRRGRR